MPCESCAGDASGAGRCGGPQPLMARSQWHNWQARPQRRATTAVLTWWARRNPSHLAPPSVAPPPPHTNPPEHPSNFARTSHGLANESVGMTMKNAQRRGRVEANSRHSLGASSILAASCSPAPHPATIKHGPCYHVCPALTALVLPPRACPHASA
eukprot:80330-Chlamydomonas_euryale.AAC.2